MMPATASETETTCSLRRSLNIYIPGTQTLSLHSNTTIHFNSTSEITSRENRKGEAMQVHALQRQAQKVKVLQIEHKL